MKYTRYVGAVAAFLAIVGASYGVWQGLAKTTPAPSVAYVLLDGQKVDSSQWRGKVMLVNFWATTCAVCVAEMPEIVATHHRFKAQGFDTLAVSMRHDTPAAVLRFAHERRLPFGVAIDNTGVIAQRFGNIQATPTTLLINKRGEIVHRHEGRPDFDALRAQVAQLLAET
jgi:peroxiredoxin